MSDINTTNTVTTNNVSSESKKEKKQEIRDKKYAEQIEANRTKKIAKLEKKKAKLTVKLNKKQNPKIKSSIQDRIDKIDLKIKDLNDPTKFAAKRPFGLVMRTWFKGLGKEAGRVTWYKKTEVIKDFVTVIIVCAFLGVIFFAIDMILIALGNI